MNTVSVIIPTFNRWATLPRALDSVLSQSRLPDEIIVVDDGSTDATADELPRRFPDVTCLRQANRGVSAARNAGIGHASSTWIAFLDSDDEWLPEKLARQLETLATQPHLQICHTDEIWVRNGRTVKLAQRYEKAGGFIFQRCLPVCAIGPSTVMIHQELLARLGAFDETFEVCEDYDLWLRICCDTEVAYTDEPLVRKHGGHADQLSTTHWGLDRYRIRALEKIIASGRLQGGDLSAAIDAAIDKIDVYIAGARKRGKASEVATYEARRQAMASGK